MSHINVLQLTSAAHLAVNASAQAFKTKNFTSAHYYLGQAKLFANRAKALATSSERDSNLMSAVSELGCHIRHCQQMLGKVEQLRMH